MFRKLMKSEALRKRTSWILAAVLIPPFLFFFHMFVSNPSDGASAGSAGTIFGKPVPWDTYQQQYQWVRNQWENRLSESSPDRRVEIPEALLPLIEETAWDRLLILEAAKRARVRISDEELAAFIKQDPTFHVNGRFWPERYHRYVQAIGQTARTFETLLRAQLMIQRMVTQVQEAAAVSDAQVRDAYVRAHERVQAAVLLIDRASFRDQVRGTITEEELRSAYAAHQDLVTTPEQVAFEYIGLTRDQLTKDLTVLEEDIARYYEDHPKEWTTADGDSAQAAEGSIRKPLEEVREEIRDRLLKQQIRRRFNALAMDLEEALASGYTLAEMAHVYQLQVQTAGPVRKDQPWVPGGPEPQVFQTALGSPEGRLSSVIETENGVYVARLTQRTASMVLPFEIARGRIEEHLVQERSRAAATTAAQELRPKLLERHGPGLTFEEAVLQEGMTVEHPAPFNRTEPVGSLGQASAVNEAAFGVSGGTVTDVVEVPQGYVLVWVEERLPADETKFSEEAADLRTQVLSQQREERLTQWLSELRTQAKIQRAADVR
jgi:peptidyl-prolyl cis-trans isomerase D